MPEIETLVETVPAISIALNDDVAVDLTALIETRLLVQANSGGGKSFMVAHVVRLSLLLRESSCIYQAYVRFDSLEQ